MYNGARLSCSHKCSITLRTAIFSEPGPDTYELQKQTPLHVPSITLLLEGGQKSNFAYGWGYVA